MENPEKEFGKKLDEMLNNERAGEVGGIIQYFPMLGKVNLNVSDDFSKKINSALLKYIEGDYSDLDYLLKVGEKSLNAHRKSGSDMMTLEISFDGFKTPTDDKFSRQVNAFYYKTELIANSLVVDSSDTDDDIMNDIYNLGVFHFHDDGSEPSREDLDINKCRHRVDWVISTKEDYFVIYCILEGISKKFLEQKLEKPFNGNCEEVVPYIEKVLSNPEYLLKMASAMATNNNF